MMPLMGIGDEAGGSLASQIRATRELNWDRIELRAVELPGYPRQNLHDLPDPAFDTVVRELDTARLQVHCLSSTIMNWSRRVQDPFEPTLAEVKRAIPRMRRLGTRLVRIMSFKPDDDEYRIPAEVFRHVKDITNMFVDAGLQPAHENCMNYGGMSWQHALELLDKCPGLKWVFDTGNPVVLPDRSKPKPWPRQDPWEFWEHLRDHTVHLHVKDATWDAATKRAKYHWPGEGQSQVCEILQDALKRGYDAGVSIEPHMAAEFHDPKTKSPHEDAARANFIAYGRRLEQLLGGDQTDRPSAQV